MTLQLNIADVLVDLPKGIKNIPINENFQTFWSDRPECDINVNLSHVESDELLNTLDVLPDESFKIWFDGALLHALKRNATGVPLWSLEAMNEEMSEYRASYNPVGFDKYYYSRDDLICKELGLLILVLSLHARGGLVFHGSASILEGNGILCVGRSGIGKSTISRILHNQGAKVLCDERPVVRLMPSIREEDKEIQTPFLYGSPWPNDGGLALNDKAPLRRIYFLEHGLDNRITPLSAKESSTRLIQCANVLWEHPKLLDPCLQTIEALLANVPTAVLSFKPDEEVVEVIRQDLATERVIV